MIRHLLQRLLVAAIAAALLLGAGIGRAEELAPTIRQADQAFNDGNHAAALALYRSAASALAPQSPLYAEVINDIAAVNMAQGELAEFARNFALARRLKQERIAPAPVREPRGGGNLLHNGGFEDGIVFPWGTGNYERSDGKFGFGLWWNSNNAKAFMKIDSAEKHSGARSLLIGNDSPAQPHVFSTLSQRIGGLKPNTVYRIACRLKAKAMKPGAGLLVVDAAWGKRFALPSGTYDWRPFSITVNIGHNDYIDFRLVHQDTGWLWIDDIVVEEEGAPAANALQYAESLVDSARYAEALAIYLEFERNNQGNEAALRHYKLYAGRIYALLGKYDQAFANINYAVDKGLARGQIDLADLHYRLGDYDAAERGFKQTLARGDFKEDQATISLIWHKLSQTYLAAGKLDQALQAQQYAYSIVRHIDDKQAQAASLHQLGGIHRQQQALAPASERLREALQLARQVDDRKLQSDIALDLAEIAQQRGDAGETRRHLDAAMPLKEAIADRVGLVKAWRLQGQLAVAEKRLDDALASYRRAVAILEGIASGVGDISRQRKANFLQQFSQLYREYVELLIRRYETSGDAAYHGEAFQVAEQARSRVFAEMVGEARASDTFAASSKDAAFRALLDQERLLEVEIAALEKQLQQAAASTAAAPPLAQRLGQARQQRQQLQEHLLAGYPRYADLKTPKPLRLDDVQRLLGDDEAALSYFVLPERTALWAISRDAASFATIPLSRKELLRQSERFRSAFPQIASDLGRFEAGGDDAARLQAILASYRPERAQALYQALVAPVESLLQGKRTVYLAPDDLLYKLPFEALLTRPFVAGPSDAAALGAELRQAPFWVNSHALAYVPSLSVLRSLRQFGKAPLAAQHPLLAFADPDFGSAGGAAAAAGAHAATRAATLRSLSPRAAGTPALAPLPETREEALYIAGLLGAAPERDVYVGARASEYNLKHLLLPRYRNLLFSTHGLMAGDFGPGTQPALALSFVGDPEDDGLLEMGEILGLDLNAELVVLSACNTASGSGGEDRGEGFAGLTRSFMYAGAKSLLVTQWSVESSSAKKLVQLSFTGMARRPKAQALAGAKRDLIAAGEVLRFSPTLAVSFAHPYFWAPFILVGEGR